MLTVACVYVQGEYPYTPLYVARLQAMCARWLRQPFRFVCLTDRPAQVSDVAQALPIARLPKANAYWTKMRLFDPHWQFPGRVLALDLDSLIVGPLDDVVDFPGALVLATDCLVDIPDDAAPLTHAVDRHQRQLVQKFQGSVMVWDGGTCTDLFTAWTPAVAARLSTDQDWIGERYPQAARMPLAWTPRISQIQHGPVPADARIIFCKKPKNDVAVARFPWVDAVWRAA